MTEVLPVSPLITLPGGPFRIWSQGAVRAPGFSVDGLRALGCPDYAAAADRLLRAESEGTDENTRRDLAAGLLLTSAQAMDRQAQVLADVAADDRFRSAVAWQNHNVVRPMVDGLSALPISPRNQRYRKKQRVVAKYWARYCAKNDTIGFFGPTVWFDFTTHGPAVTLEAGPELMKWTATHFENWPIDTLADVLARQEDIRPWVAPRLHPAMYLVPGMLIQHEDAPAFLDPPTETALRLCDGVRQARDVAAGLIADHPDVVADEAAGYAKIADLAEKGWLFWDLEPPLGEDPDLVLRGRLMTIGDLSARERALTALDTLVAAKDKVAAAGSPEELLTTLADLDNTFVALTGANPSVRSGTTYGARQIAYQDGERDLELTLGPDIVEAIGAPVSLLLLGARWLTHRLAEHYEQVFSAAYDAMVAQSGGTDTINFMMLAYACGDELFTPGTRGSDRIMAEFATMWRDALGMDTDASRVDVTSEQVRERLAEKFADAQPGWAYATHHGVDVQIAAASAEALRAGEFEPVIGEIHAAWNTLQSTMFVNTHPDVAALKWLTNAGVGPRIVLTPVKTWPRITTRTTGPMDNGQDWSMAVSEFPGGHPDRRLALAELSVRRAGDRLEVVNGDRSASFGILDVIGVWMAEDIGEGFKGVTWGHAHSPRVRVDRLVVVRESWTLPVAGLPFLKGKGEEATFLEVRRWLLGAGLPRYVFVKASTEMKPFYNDFTSPVLVANLVTALRGAADEDKDATVTFSEMHPDPEHCWLTDGQGRRYTSEFRIQAVDPVRPY
jgi:hypothetical protein